MGKHKIKQQNGIKESYKYYINSLDKEDKKSDYGITQTQYSDILYSFHKKVYELMINNAFEFKMFSNIGSLSIRKYKIGYQLDKNGGLEKKYLRRNFFETIKLRKNDKEAERLKKVVYFDNKHTDGYKFYCFWDKKRFNGRNVKYYCFRPTRANNRNLAAVLLDPNSKVDFYNRPTRN